MNNNGIIGIVAGLVTIVILLGSLTAPTIAGFTDATKTYYNDGTPFALTDSEDTDTHTLVFGSDDDGNIEITLDGNAVEVPDFSLYGAASVIYGADAYVRFNENGALILFGNNGTLEHASPTLGNCLEEDVTFTIVGTTVTVGTYVMSDAFAYISDEGDYRLCQNPYVNEDSVVYAGAYNNISSQAFGIVLYGALDDLTGDAVYPSGRELGTITPSLTNICTDLYCLDSITVECIKDDVTVGTMTVNFLLAPYEIVYNNPDYLGATAAALLVPVTFILIVAMVLVIGRAASRDD